MEHANTYKISADSEDSFDTNTRYPPPPANEAEILDWLQLRRCYRVGSQTFLRLLSTYKSAENALAALPEIARDNAKLAAYQIFDRTLVEREYRAGMKLGAKLLCIGMKEYPQNLYALSAPPVLLWAYGAGGLLAKPPLSIIGARNASALGLKMAEKLASELGEKGYSIVSGLARGIDTAAHRGALNSGTIAILAGGVDKIYPYENTALAAKIRQNGLLLSEMPMGYSPQARHFHARNRLIAALGYSTTIVEATLKSGSLTTAGYGLEIGREVCAVPGHPFDQRSAGTNALIRDGARLVRSADDIIEATEITSPSQQAITQYAPAASGLSEQKRPAIAPATTGFNDIGSAAIAPAPPRAEEIAAAKNSEKLRRQKRQKETGAPFHAAKTQRCADGDGKEEARSQQEIAKNSAARAVEKEILSRLSAAPLCEDHLIRSLGLPAQRLALPLLRLELDGKIARGGGGMITRL